mgnify:CR=1 FL=1
MRGVEKKMHEISEVLEELCKTVKRVSYEEETAIASAIQKAKRIFVAGSGRSGLIASCFAMRLMQSGITAYRVGECTTPAIEADDLLLITSGSGETGALVKNAETAKKVAEGTKPSAETDFQASTFFYAPNTYYHIESVKSLYRPETTDTRSKSPTSEYRTQTYGIVDRIEDFGVGAILSGKSV